MREQLDNFTSPAVAAPIVTTSALVNTLVDNMPLLLNIGSAIYLALLITHKAWQMWKEYKRKDESS